jgi:hypothetical protein
MLKTDVRFFGEVEMAKTTSEPSVNTVFRTNRRTSWNYCRLLHRRLFKR